MTAQEWVESHTSDAPAHLRSAMVEAVQSESEGPVPDRLARAALTLYRQVVAGSGCREDAFPLLAADALLTHAFEAQAELAPEELLDFTGRWDGRRIAELLG